jgi:hypothetical protein
MYAHPTKENHKFNLELLPVGRSGKSLDTVYLYEVSGLPLGEQAWIAEMNGIWQISHTKNTVLGDWTGDYKSPEVALAVLKRKFRT